MSDLAEEYESSGYGHVADALIYREGAEVREQYGLPGAADSHRDAAGEYAQAAADLSKAAYQREIDLEIDEADQDHTLSAALHLRAAEEYAKAGDYEHAVQEAEEAAGEYQRAAKLNEDEGESGEPEIPHYQAAGAYRVLARLHEEAAARERWRATELEADGERGEAAAARRRANREAKAGEKARQKAREQQETAEAGSG